MPGQSSDDLLALFDTAPLNRRYWVAFILLSALFVLEFFDFLVVGYLLAGPVLIIIDFTSGMPWWWIIGDGGGCLLIGVVILWLEYGPSKTQEPSALAKGGNS